MAPSGRTLGVSISDRSVQAVEIERKGSVLQLLALDEWENTISPADADDGEAGLARFAEYLTAFMKVNHVRARRASVAIDTGNLFMVRIPIESGMPRNEISRQIAWELEQYFPDTPPKEFITDIITIAEHEAERWKEVLSVSVRRRYVAPFQKVLTGLGLELFVLDADHFSAETALRTNYPDTYRKHLAFVGVKESRLDISLLKNGALSSYSYTRVTSNREIVERIGRLSRETPGIYSISTYGPYLDNDLLVQIRRGSALLVEALNPLRHINVSDTLRLADHLSVPSYRFAAAVGVALRKD